MEQIRPPSLPSRVESEPQDAAAITDLAGASITVQAFRFTGNTLLSQDQLREALANYLHRPLNFQQLQQATNTVAAAYRTAGWVVRADLPKQDVTDGMVTIRVVEAAFGQIRREGIEPLRLRMDYALASITAQQETGKPLNAKALDRALLLLDDLPGVNASGTLASGKQDGETDLVLKLTSEPLATGDVSVDNAGAQSTGAGRYSANLALNSPLGIGDLLTAQALHAQGMDYVRVAYSIPVGHDGVRWGVNASNLNYRLVSHDFNALAAKGTADTLGMEATYPLLRSRQSNVYLGINRDLRKYDNQSLGSSTSRYQVSTSTISANGNLFDTLGGGGVSSGNIAWVDGNVDLSGSSNEATDASSSKTAGHFNKVRYQAARQQSITQAWSFYATVSGQRANNNLDSSEKFYLGGINGVRAYPASEGGGTEGQLANVELRWQFAPGLVFSGFYDWGSVTVNRNNDFASAASPNAYELRGNGLALTWQAESGLNIKTIWARRVGDNPNPTNAGLDQDGTLVRDRFWLQASLPF